MNKQSAINLVQTTFERPYNRDRFLTFAKNIFHSFEEASFIYRGNYIPDAYKKQIKTLERIGKYEDHEGNKIDILTVCVSQGTTLERARTLQRNFISWYLNGSRGDITKDAALVAFYVEGSNDWRLSLVKMEYRLDKSESGRLKTFTELTPAKRFSFFVGEGENTHTAQRQLLPILLREDAPPTLSDLEKAFSVEVVTKEFFEKYKQLFLDTKEALDKIVKADLQIQSDFQDKNIDTVDFTKKLLGQIVFLYFLQKKGWFGVSRDDNWGTGPREFLRLLFEKNITDYDNYFNDILEPLFYEALAIERPDDFYSRFDCKIPFLNGGLFDPLNNYDWVHTDIRLPNYLFSNDKPTKEGDKGTGILDVFDRYNFTVKEDEPLEKEVAVDPEMLGKVFENLLEVKDRKSKGTYYTPREIVHYMCQESLVNYLVTELDGKVSKEDIETLVQIGEAAVEHDTQVTKLGEETETYSYKLPASVRQHAKAIDEALVNIRVCDPAVGSGAFLVGMMTEIIRVRNTISSYLVDGDRSIYTFKHHAIQNSLYGVDIDPGATEIAKLRLWLSLIVDEQDIKRIKPLPNLDYKIMQGNSLLEEYEGIKLFDEELFTKSTFDNSAQIADIKEKMSELQRQFFELHSKGEYRSTKMQQIEAELKRHSNTLKKMTQPPKIKAENASLFDQASEAKQKADELKRLQREFFNTAHKNEKDRIKKQIETLTWEFIEATLREQGKESLMREIEKFRKTNVKPFFIWKLNYSEVFESKGGFDVIIGNPPYGSTIKGQLRIDILNSLGKVPDFEIYYFFLELGKKLLRQQGLLTYIIPNTFLFNVFADKYRQQLLTDWTIHTIVDCTNFKLFASATVFNAIVLFEKDGTGSYVGYKNTQYANSFSDLVSQKTLKVKPEALLAYNQNWGLVFRLPEEVLQLVTKIKSESIKLQTKFPDISQGLIAYDKYQGQTKDVIEKRAYHYFQKIRDDLKPWLYGEDVKKYSVQWNGREWIDYCSGIANPRQPKFFRGPRILIREITNPSVYAAYTDKELYNDPSVIVVLDNPESNVLLKYVLGILNSSLATFYHFNASPKATKGGFPKILVKDIQEFPIKVTSNENQELVVEYVNEILEITTSSSNLENSSMKEKIEKNKKFIDQQIYKVYDLTPEEIAIVEGGQNDA